MVAASYDLIESGCDYITVTSKSTNPNNLLVQVARTIVEVEVKAGNVLSDWQALGYKGVRCGSASVGCGEQGTIARLSSGIARDYYHELLPYAENCSRFDLQSTVRCSIEPRKFVLKQFKSICAHEEKFKRPRSVKMIVSRTGAETLMMGSRQSDRYGRVYDKFAESGLEHYRNCVRLEVEFKNNFAVANAAACANQQSAPAWVHSQVCTWMSKRGGALGSIPVTALVHCTPAKNTNDLDTLRYISKCVRPVLSRMVRRVGISEVLEATGLSDYVIVNQRDLA